MWQKIRDNFVAGIAVILPAVVTIWLLSFLYNAINRKLLMPITDIFTPYLPSLYLEYAVSFVIFLLLIFFIVTVGMATRILFLRKFFSSGERVFFKIPMIGRIYVTMKQMSRAFLGDKSKGLFKRTVLVEYPRKGVFSLGFLTAEDAGVLSQDSLKHCIVYIPSAPNPTSGFFIIVPSQEVRPINLSVEDAIKIIISGGAISLDESD